ncbi:uncharacterized protein K489DRAFT_388563 [Dissoconium aciculare CBS 342.82]|jgi:hypothetical protein|uniref:Uncharacterized protein n=1 Tax=Dissoconium aciculare CBS 342.82 TaxID=1314786 RepID=A0A6J3M6S7_9PEZI|nr:uncharacterized protein K489DRAFT_388563 [Dissoconium aciculare CBS 342.82]KAF1822572.1 hypothetical protein K489DRAFT_388563 [Dissoconium aciculare CBS 342.82]
MKQTIILSVFAALSTAVAGATLESRATCGETDKRVCYGVDSGTSQDVNLDDVQYAADYLRYLGTSNKGLDAMWKMPAAVGTCDEWQLPVDYPGTVLSLAKHIVPRYAAYVLYTDIADAIDGGENASAAAKKQALLGACGVHGGMVGVKTNSTNPAYNTAEYKKTGAKPTGLLVKIVKNNAQ